ncbi:MAG: ligand-binding sensor domain-containing protein, partial [Flavobacteriales bacterium]
MRVAVGAVLVPLLLFAARAGAQQYDLRTFSLEQGLPSAAVNAICEDADGFLWLATDQGLARSQGSRFEAFDEQQGAPATEATALLPTVDRDGQGRLLTGFRTGALAWWGKGRFRPITTAPALPAHAVRTILVGNGHSVVLGTRGGGVWQVDTVTYKATAMNAGLSSLRINGLVHQGNGFLAATDSGLFRWAGSRWAAVETAQLPKGTRALALIADSLGVLVGTDHGYLELDRELRPLPITERVAGLQPLALPHAVVLSVLRAGRYDLWLGTPAGLVDLVRENGVPKLTS